MRDSTHDDAPVTQNNLTPLAHSAQNRCFGCGPANPVGMQLEFKLAVDKAVVCDAWVADTYEGPRGYVHGGIIATLIDETMSKAVRAHNFVAMTRHMEVDYRRPVPSRSPLRLMGRLVRSEGRKHWTEAAILDMDGNVLAQGKGLFIEVKPRKEEPVLSGEPTPHG
jgi:uncharacterized protein (TIGR00369 family)